MNDTKKTGYVQGNVRVNTQKHFDSRNLGPCDAYFRLLRKPKDYKYKALSTKKGDKESRTESVRLVESETASRNVNIDIRLDRFNHPRISKILDRGLPAHSVLIWHVVDAVEAKIRIEGREGARKKFTNTELNHHDGFSHTFLYPGTYKYHNGKKGNQRKFGVVTVGSVYEEKILSKERMPKPVLVRCTPEGFDPAKVTVIPGQTVGWLIYDVNVAIIQEKK